MVSFPNGKINLGLHVTGKRDDGFHNIQTVFYPVAIHDVLEVIPAKENSFNSSGIIVNGPAEQNLCLQAYTLLKQDFPLLPAVAMHLYKNIPIGAGLGGGSADAIGALQLLDQLGDLQLSEEQLSAYALQLGSDCPFFLINKPCLATGRGEELTKVDIDLSAYDILLINPGIHINTGWAFSALKTYSAHADLQSIVSRPVAEWKEHLHNDFERVVLDKYPEIRFLKARLYELGATYASLSGSGSTVYALFEKNVRPEVQLPSYFVKWL